MLSTWLVFIAVQSVGLAVGDEVIPAASPEEQASATDEVSEVEDSEDENEGTRFMSLRFTGIAGSAPQATQEYADLYTPLEYVDPDSPEDAEKQIVKYRLYEPPDLKEGERTPLFVWLHGLQEWGDNNFSQLRWLHNSIGFSPEGLRKRRMHVLAMQCPQGTTWGGANDVILKSIIDHSLETCSIDQNRIYLSGMSAGGSGCWDLAIRYPDTFAAIISLSGVGGSFAELARIKDVPIWAFYKTFDGIEPVRDKIETLKGLGGRVHLTEQKGMGHIVTIHRHPGLFDWWMFSQERGKPASFRPPGALENWDDLADKSETVESNEVWQPHQLAIQIGVPTLVLLACIQEYRRRQSKPITTPAEEAE